MKTLLAYNYKNHKGHVRMGVLFDNKLYILSHRSNSFVCRNDLTDPFTDFNKSFINHPVYQTFTIDIDSLSLENVYRELPELLL